MILSLDGNEQHGYNHELHEHKPAFNMPYVAQQTQENYSVPNHMVGLLIGKGGENLKKIERMSGVTKVQFDNGIHSHLLASQF